MQGREIGLIKAHRCGDCGYSAHSQRHIDACGFNERTLCRLCGLVWLSKGDVCGPNLRSEAEDRMLAEERRRSA